MKATQTKTQVQPGSERCSFADERAAIHIAQSYNAIAASPIDEAYYRLSGLGGAIKNHPKFKELAAAIETIRYSCCELNSFVNDCACIREYGDKKNEYTEEQRREMEWFLDYHDGLAGKPFLTTVHHYSGFVGRIKADPFYKTVVGALSKIISGAEVLERFAMHNSEDGLVKFVREDRQNKGGAR